MKEHTRNNPTSEERFWAKVENVGECRIWNGALNNWGYGKLRADNRHLLAHRVAWEYANGPIPDGMNVDHMCFNRACVNHEHLRLATQKQNMEHLQTPRSKSGYRGVRQVGKKWMGRVSHHDVRYATDLFPTASEANDATVKLRNKLFTHNLLDR